MAEIDERIVEIARGRFLEDGFAATSMNKLAAEIGVSKETLYARYPNKERLFGAIVQDRLAAWTSRVAKPASPEATLGERLRRRAMAILESVSTPDVQAFERLLAAEAVRFPGLARQFYEQGYRVLVDNVRQDLTEALGGNGDAAVSQASDAAAIFGGALIGWFRIESAIRKVGPAELERYADAVVRNCLGSLGLA